MRRSSGRAAGAAVLALCCSCRAAAPPQTLDPLNRLIEGQVLSAGNFPPLANQSFSFMGSFPITVLNTSLGDLHVGTLTVDEYEVGAAETHIGLTVTGVGFDLRTYYLYDNGYDVSGGTLNISAPHDDVAITATVRFTGPAPFAATAPRNATLDRCSIDLGNFSVASDGGYSFLFGHDNIASEATLVCSQILPGLLTSWAGNASEILSASTGAVDPTEGVAAQEAALWEMPGADQLFSFANTASAAAESMIGVLSPPGAANATGLNALLDKPGVWAGVAERLGLGSSFPRALNAAMHVELLQFLPSTFAVSDQVANVSLTQLNVTGLDNVTALRYDGHAGNFSLLIGVEMGHLRIDAAAEVELRNPVTGYAVRNTVTFGADVYGASLNLTVLLGVNATKFAQLQPGMLAEVYEQYRMGFPVTYILLCALWPVQALNITTMALGLRGLPPPVDVTGVLPSAGAAGPSVIDAAAAGLLRGAVETYGGAVFRALPTLTQRHLLPELLGSAYWSNFMITIAGHSGADPLPLKWACPQRAGGGWGDVTAPGLVDLSNSSAVAAARWAADELLAPPSPADANALLRAALPSVVPALPGGAQVSAAGDRVSWPGTVLDYSVEIPGLQLGQSSPGTVAVQVADAVLSGFDHISALDILRPRGAQEPQTLDNSAVWAGPPLQLNITVRLRLSGRMAPTPVDDTVRLSLGVGGLRTAAGLQLRANASALEGLQFGQMTDADCLLSALSGPRGYVRVPDGSVRASVAAMVADAVCLPGACSSPRMGELHGSLTAPAAVTEMTGYTNELIGDAVRYVPELLPLLGVTGDSVDDWIAQRARQCGVPKGPSAETPAPPGGDGSDAVEGPLTKAAVYCILYGVSGLVFLVLALNTAAAHRRDRARGAGERRPLLRHHDAEEQEDSGHTDGHRRQSLAHSHLSVGTAKSVRSTLFEATYVPASDLCLAQHPAIPLTVRVLHPCLVAAAAVLFVTSNIAVGAEIVAKVNVAGSALTLDNLFDYSLANTVTDFWNAGVYPLAILVGVLSGVWPYVKLALLLYAWFAPPSLLRSGPRGVLLRVTDFLGKWSLIDEFLLIMMINAFHVQLDNPAQWDFLPPGFVTLEVLVEPRYGMHGFLAATILSLALNHMELIWHRNVAEADLGRGEGWFAVGREDPSRQLLASVAGRAQGVGVTFLLLCTGASLITGMVIQTFSFDFKGLAAIAMNYEGSADNTYSVLSLAKGVLDQSGSSAGGKIAYGWLMGAFLITAIIVPLIQVACLLVLWLCPLRLRHQKQLFFTNEVLAAWSAIEVLIVSLLAALLQLSTFATFILGGKCDAVNALAREYAVPLGLLTDGQATCFDIKAELLDGFWSLAVACVLSNGVYMVAYRATENAITVREAEIVQQRTECGASGPAATPHSEKGGSFAAVRKVHRDAPRP